MSEQFELPRIMSDTPEGQIAELRSYLWQFVEKMNYILNHLSGAGGEDVELQTESGGYSGTGNPDKEVALGKDSIENVYQSGMWYIRRWKSGFREMYSTIDVPQGLSRYDNRTFEQILPISISRWNIVHISATYDPRYGGQSYPVAANGQAINSSTSKISAKLVTKTMGDLADGTIYVYIAIKPM